MKVLNIVIAILILIGISSCMTILTGVSSCMTHRLSKKDISFNPYKEGDTLFFQSDKGKKDTLIIVSFDKFTYHDKCYSRLQCLWLFLTEGTWQSYYIYAVNIHYSFPRRELLSIGTAPNGVKLIHFDMWNNWSLQWYGFEPQDRDDLSNMKKILNYPTSTFHVNSQIYDDVITIKSTNQEYRNRQDFIETLYWSKSMGYVGFDMLNGEKWTIIKK